MKVNPIMRRANTVREVREEVREVVREVVAIDVEVIVETTITRFKEISIMRTLKVLMRNLRK